MATWTDALDSPGLFDSPPGDLLDNAPESLDERRGSSNNHSASANGGIEEYIVALRIGHDLERKYPRIDFDGCDTAIIIDPPPKTNDMTPMVYDIICRHYERVFPAKSGVLKQYSPSYFGPMFEPAKQKRLSARLASKKLDYRPFHPTYVLDLTPSIEGDDALILLMDLYCPLQVRRWHLSRIRFRCPKELVGGTEEFSDPARGEKGDPTDREEDFPLVADYTQVRHHRAIERVILALHNEEIDLDSAVKLYTTAAVAKNFQLVNNPLQELASTWIYQPQNKFLEIVPEESLRIADWLQAGYIARDAFSILVGEEALERARGAPPSSQTTLRGRKRAEVDEAWRTRIEYARESFEQRITVCFDSIVDQSMEWVEALPRMRDLVRLREALQAGDWPEAYLRAELLIKALKGLVRHAIFSCLCSSVVLTQTIAEGFIPPNSDRASLFPRSEPVSTWNSQPWRSRIFTSNFWRMITTLDLTRLGETGFFGFASGEIGSSNVVSMNGRDFGAREAFLEAGFEGPLTGEALRDIYSIMGELKVCLSQQASTSAAPQNSLFDLPVCLRGASSIGIPGESSEPMSGAHSSAQPTGPPTNQPQRPRWQPQYELPPFNMFGFLQEVEEALQVQATSMLAGPPSSTLTAQNVGLLNVLICLEEDEMQCLPLWAGGCDDGTGGAFSTVVAASDDQFEDNRNLTRNGGPEDFEMVSYTNSEVPTSCLVHDGYSEVLDRRRVYAESEMDSDASLDTLKEDQADTDGDEVWSVASDTSTIKGDAADDFEDIFLSTGDFDHDD